MNLFMVFICIKSKNFVQLSKNISPWTNPMPKTEDKLKCRGVFRQEQG
jgi:hypothetical protein